MIEITNVSKRFGRSLAVDDATLEIQAGDSVALWGVNGAGKSTLIRCMLGLLSFRGTIRIDGHDVRKRGKRARMCVGYVPQEIGFYDDLGVAEAVRYFGKLKGIRMRSTEGVLERVGLLGHESKRIRELSGGMKQRLALAIALLGDPPVLIMDEVTASLDVAGRQEFISFLSELSGRGRTMLFASHRSDEIANLAGRVVVMERGRIKSVQSADAFAEGLDSHVTLHLLIAASARGEAIAVLNRGGYSPTMNGVGVLVPVTARQKGGPFALLNKAQIAIDDFHVLTRHDVGHVRGTEGSTA